MLDLEEGIAQLFEEVQSLAPVYYKAEASLWRPSKGRPVGSRVGAKELRSRAIARQKAYRSSSAFQAKRQVYQLTVIVRYHADEAYRERKLAQARASYARRKGCIMTDRCAALKREAGL